MPSYCWECEACKKQQDVVRSMSDYERGPDEKCECGSETFKRIIPQWRPEQTHLVHGGRAPWFAESYFGPKGIPTGK